MVIGLFALVVLGVLVAGLGGSTKKTGSDLKKDPLETPPPLKGKPCPLCNSPLIRGERVHSVLFQSSRDDKIMEIYGCPYCYKDHPKGEGKFRYGRNCPVCHKSLETADVVSARVFTRQNKMHVHVLGCPQCRKSSPK